MPDLILTLAYTACIFAIGAVAGRSYGLYRHATHQAKLSAAVTELEERVAELNQQLAVDPLHAAVVHGQRIVIHQIERVLKELKEAFET